MCCYSFFYQVHLKRKAKKDQNKIIRELHNNLTKLKFKITIIEAYIALEKQIHKLCRGDVKLYKCALLIFKATINMYKMNEKPSAVTD